MVIGETLKFFVDEIFPIDTSKNLFSTKIILDINSSLFLPFHTRFINVTGDLLEADFYESMLNKFPELPKNIKHKGSVIQGGYYEIPKYRNFAELFRPSTIVSGEGFELKDDNFTIIQDIFDGHLKEPPYKLDDGILKEKLIPLDKGAERLCDYSNINKLDAMYLYCFNVGQGDSFLLLFPNGNSYLIDINFYNAKLVRLIKNILRHRKLPQNHLKAVVITHKHLDHLRGMTFLSNFHIDYLLINFDYKHETNAVISFLDMAKSINKWINVNDRATIHEGKCELFIENPTRITRNKSGAPDINDSSIVMCVKYRDDMVYLTGDAGYPVLEQNLKAVSPYHGILKVSHHGSISGTSAELLNRLVPIYAFISAGTSKRYRHPHQQVLDCLRAQPSIQNITVSKLLNYMARYKITGNKIYLSKR